MACVDIVKDTREDITRFMSDSYIFGGGGACVRVVGLTHNILRLLLNIPLNMCGYESFNGDV